MSNFKIKDQDGNFIKLLSENDKTTTISATSTDEQVPTAKAVYDAIGQSGGELQEGIGIEITKEEQTTTISAKIGTNSELGVIKADGVTTFLDPDGTISSKATLPDITAGQGINITYGAGHNLPDGYTELVFVRGKAGCYLDTGINADYTTAFRVKAQRLANPSEAFNVFGATVSGQTAGVQFLNNNNARCFSGSAAATYASTITGIFYDTLVFYSDVNKRTITNTLTGEIIENDTVYSTQFDIKKNYYIGRMNGATVGADFTGRIFEIEIWKSGILVRDYIPAKKNDTQDIGFYDIVNNNFVTATTSAQFIEGPDAIPNTVISNIEFQGATLEKDGVVGGVPAPMKNDLENVLFGTGEWELPIIKKRVLKGDENNKIHIYVSLSLGEDLYQFGRGLNPNENYFASVQGALNIISKLYVLDTDNGELVIDLVDSGGYKTTIAPLDIPYIETKNTSLRLDNLEIYANDEIGILRNCGGIPTIVSDCRFYLEAGVKPKTVIEIDNSEIKFIAETRSKLTQLDMNDVPIDNVVSIKNNGRFINESINGQQAFTIADYTREGVSHYIYSINSTIISDIPNVPSSQPKGIVYDLLYSNLYITEHMSIWIVDEVTPYNLVCSNMYIPNTTVDELFNKQGTKDAVSYIYDQNGTH